MKVQYTSNSGKTIVLENVQYTGTDYFYVGDKTYKIDNSGLYPVLKSCFFRQIGAFGGGGTVQRTIGRYPVFINPSKIED